LESEGIREADINVAEGKKRSKILASGKDFLKDFKLLDLPFKIFF